MKTIALALLSILALQSAQAKASFESTIRADRDYAGVKASLKLIADTFPQNAKGFVLGESDSGDKIIGLEIGNGPVHNLVVATHHGNEYGSTEVALAFANELAKQPIANQTVYVIPVLNIGGYNKRSRNESSSKGLRKSYDPNRNYPSPCGTEGPFTLKSTSALAQFIKNNNIVASATLHTYFPAVVFPWGLPTKDLTTGYESIFKGMAAEATRDSHYKTGNTSQVIYPVAGSYEDYAFEAHGIWSMLFELGSTHNPNASQIKEMARVNVPGLRRMLESAPGQRAEKHAFTGKCDMAKKSLDRHDE